MEIDTKQAPILEVSGSVTLEEYIEANRVLLLNTTTARKFGYLIYVRYGYLIGGLLLAIGIATICIVGIGQTNGAKSSDFWAGLDGWLGPLILGLALYWLIVKGSYRRSLKKRFKQFDWGREFAAKFDAEGICSARLDGTAESRIKWEAFQYWKESPAVFVLFLSKAKYFCVSKRLLQLGDEESLRELLAAKIPADRG